MDPGTRLAERRHDVARLSDFRVCRPAFVVPSLSQSRLGVAVTHAYRQFATRSVTNWRGEQLQRVKNYRAENILLKKHCLFSGGRSLCSEWRLMRSLSLNRMVCEMSSTSSTGQGTSVEPDQNTTELPSRLQSSEGGIGNELQDPQPLLDEMNSAIAKGAVRKLVNMLTEAEDDNGPYSQMRIDSQVYRAATRGLVRNLRLDLAVDVLKMRASAAEKRPSMFHPDVALTANVLRRCLRQKRKRNAVKFDTCFLMKELQAGCDEAVKGGNQASRNISVLTSLTAGILDREDLSEESAGDAEWALQLLRQQCKIVGDSSSLSVSEFNDLIRLFGKKRRVDSVFSVLDAIQDAGLECDNETYEFLANAVVRQVEFVTGAVSMKTLPPPLRAEVAFFGRSNVGKSSLVNMLCNRKALAHVSGRPGKTQQFNFFAVNAKQTNSAFYLVDLPGVGFAKVPKKVQESWLKFMDNYIASRPSLCVVFHLVDGRHGPQSEDELLMSRVSNSRYNGEYVIVITKADKAQSEKALDNALQSTEAALNRNGCPADTQVIVTSATTRRGRDELWKFLRRAVQL